MTTDDTQERCTATRADGRPCTAPVMRDGLCFGHQPRDIEACARGGQISRRGSKAMRMLPTRLRPVAELLEKALEEVHTGKLDPLAARAMASLANALVNVFKAGELEEQARQLETMLADREREGERWA